LSRSLLDFYTLVSVFFFSPFFSEVSALLSSGSISFMASNLPLNSFGVDLGLRDQAAL